MGWCRPSEEKESGVRFRMAMRWVLRVGRVEVITGLGGGSDVAVSEVVEGRSEWVRGVCGERGFGLEGSTAS